MKKRLNLLILITAGLIPWQSTHANSGYVIKDFVCETDKTMSCFSINNSGNDIEDMQKDFEVCNCLEDKFGLKIKNSLTPSEVKERDQKLFEGKILASLDETAKNIEKKAEPYLLESLLINPDNPTEAVQQVFDTLQAEELSKWVVNDLEKYRNKVSPQFYQGIIAQIDKYTKSQNNNLVNKLKESKDKLQERGFCLSYEGFLSTKMIPDNPLFWQALNESTEFFPVEWDVNYLEKEIREGKNIETNKAKLTFLEMNPTIKTVFRSEDRELKQALLTTLKQVLIPDPGCIRKNDCQGVFFSQGVNLPQLLKEFYEKAHLRAGISASLFHEVRKEAHILNDIDSQPLNLSAIRFASDNKTASYRQCGGGIDPQKTGQCADVLQNYCTDLRTSGDSILQVQDGELVNRTRFRLDDSIFSEADKNQEYYDKNDFACNKMKRKDNNTKKEITYKEFKTVECSRRSCSNLTDVDLFKQFMNSSKSLDKGFIFDTQSNNERLIAGIANSSRVNLSEKVLSIASRDHTLPEERNKSSGDNSINDVIANIEKSRMNTSPQADTSVTTTTTEGIFSTPEIIADGESLDGSMPGQDISLQNLGTFGNQAYLNAPNQFLAKVEEETGDKKEADISIKETNSFATMSSENSIKDSIESKDMSLEERIKGLEKLLAEKDSSTKSYQKMITQLLENKGNIQAAQASKSANSPEASETLVDRRISSIKSNVQNAPKTLKDQQASHTMEAERNTALESFPRDVARAPASLGSSSTGQSFAATTSKRVNNALLTKYGIVVKDGPTGSTSSVSVAEDADGSKFSGVKSIAEAADVPLQVSVRDFEQIKTNNLGALEALYTKELKGIDDQVVKVLVSTNSSEEVLEFYAIKEEGRVVFQPIRKNKLIDLQNVLHR